MKNTIIIFLLCTTIAATAQDKSENIYMKDGTVLGNRETLVSECATGMGESDAMNGFNKESICDCMLSTLAKHFTMREFTKMTSSKNFNYEKLFSDKKRPELGQDLFACIISNAAEMKKGDTAAGVFQKEFIASCKAEAKKSVELKDYDLEVYCVCAFNKMKEKNLSVKELQNLGKDLNSTHANEIAIPCLEEARLSKAPIDKGNDVEGEKNRDEVPLLKLGNIHRVKLKFGAVEKYFTLDSGASDVLIDKNLGKALFDRGIINKDNYDGEGTYTLADGRKVKAKNYTVSGIVIGSFTVNNVQIGIIDTEEASLLCGKSLLDKFSVWKVSNENSTLILEK
jgi:hypothetical protein